MNSASSSNLDSANTFCGAEKWNFVRSDRVTLILDAPDDITIMHRLAHDQQTEFHV